MAVRYTKDQLDGMNREMLITLFLGLQDQYASIASNLELLQEQIAIMNQRKYGRKSEAKLTQEDCAQARFTEVDGELIVVFNEAEAEASPLFETSEEEILPEASTNKKRTKGQREADLSGFPVMIKEHQMTEKQLKDIFGDMKYKRLPDEVYKRLVYKPATQIVVEHHVAVYAGEDNETMVKADRPKDLIRNSIVTPSLAAAIFNGKYVNALPYYRLEQEFRRKGLALSRQTMANWTIRIAEEYLSLLYDEMHRELYQTHVLHADETPVAVSKDGRKAGSKSYMWVYRTGGYDQTHPLILYEYQKTRQADHPREFLKDFKGVLVTDGYEVYHSLEKEKEDLKIAGCWAHARRKFAEVVKSCGASGSEKNTLAYQALEKIQDIYRLDHALDNLAIKERKRIRQTSIRPLVDAFFKWVRKNQPKVAAKSATGKGFTYCLNQEKYLRRFLSDGEVPIDNNDAERAIRGFCIGKKNWVLIDTVRGAKASAILYSIAETAKANHFKPYHYFEYLLTQILEHMDDKNTDFLKDLLPWSPTIPDSCKL